MYYFESKVHLKVSFTTILKKKIADYNEDFHRNLFFCSLAISSFLPQGHRSDQSTTGCVRRQFENQFQP